MMKKIFVALLGQALLANSSQAIITHLEFDPETSARWAKKSFPNVCEVHVHHSGGGSHGSGVLINETTVLTAAHVVRAGQDVKQTMVNFAQLGAEFDTQEPFRMINTIIAHPDHQMDKNYYCGGVDLAILKFSEPIHNITPVKLYSSAIKDNQQGYIVGYGASGKSNVGKTGPADIRHMGTTRISKSFGNYLAYNYDPIVCELDTAPDTFHVTPMMDKQQSLPVERDSGGPFLLGKAPNELFVAGIAHGGVVAQYDQESHMMYKARFEWIALYPHLEWIKANM